MSNIMILRSRKGTPVFGSGYLGKAIKKARSLLNLPILCIGNMELKSFLKVILNTYPKIECVQIYGLIYPGARGRF